MSPTERQITAAVDGYWLVGEISSSGNRIQDVLKDGSSEILRMINVRVCDYGQPSSPRESLPEMLIPKGQVTYVLPTAEHEAPEKRRDNFSSRAAANATVVLGRYCIHGRVHLPASHYENQVYTFTTQLGRFFPVTHATLTHYGNTETVLDVPVVLINKDHVSGFHLGQPAAGDGAPGEQTSVELRSIIADESLLSLFRK